MSAQSLQELVDGSRRIVFFGGAGVSTESGIRIFAAWTGCTT
jgi:NAD-dependent deacetylase